MLEETNENCLYLSIYTPAEETLIKESGAEGLLPVLVWIHGGSFQYGCGMFPISGPERFIKVDDYEDICAFMITFT